MDELLIIYEKNSIKILTKPMKGWCLPQQTITTDSDLNQSPHFQFTFTLKQPEQPGLVEGIPDHGRGVGTRWPLTAFPTQTILLFHD